MTTKKSPGRKSKDAKIMNGFNQTKIYNDDPEIKRLMILEKRKLYRRAYRKRKREEAQGIPPREDTQELIDYQLWRDMLWTYRQLGGRQRLREFMKGNRKAYELMVKELMKMESQLKQAELRKNERHDGSNEQNVVVIIKGLYDEEKRYPVDVVEEKPVVDAKSVARISAPDVSDYEEPEQEDEEDT